MHNTLSRQMNPSLPVASRLIENRALSTERPSLLSLNSALCCSFANTNDSTYGRFADGQYQEDGTARMATPSGAPRAAVFSTWTNLPSSGTVAARGVGVYAKNTGDRRRTLTPRGIAAVPFEICIAKLIHRHLPGKLGTRCWSIVGDFFGAGYIRTATTSATEF